MLIQRYTKKFFYPDVQIPASRKLLLLFARIANPNKLFIIAMLCSGIGSDGPLLISESLKIMYGLFCLACRCLSYTHSAIDYA